MSYFQLPLWSSGQSSWLQIQRLGFDSRRYQIFWEVVNLERGPLSLMSTIEELLARKSSGSVQENREYGCRGPLRWPRDTPPSAKVVTNFAHNGGSSVGIVRFQTHSTEFFIRYFQCGWFTLRHHLLCIFVKNIVPPQNYLVSRLCPSSGFLNTRGKNISAFDHHHVLKDTCTFD
jgi:hypothetical protein